MEAVFFKTQAALRKWFEKNHQKETELWIGYYKVGSGIQSISPKESLDEALCFGWIDGIRKSIDDKSYMNRYTPRKPTSNWSDINIKKFKELKKLGLVKPKGDEAFAWRNEKNTKTYPSEQKAIELGEAYEKIFKKNKKAWEFFNAQSSSYKKLTMWWIISAKQEETRLRRLNQLIDDSAAGLKIKEMRRAEKK